MCLTRICSFFFFNDTATTEIYTLSLHDALPIYERAVAFYLGMPNMQQIRFEYRAPTTGTLSAADVLEDDVDRVRSEEHTSELQSRQYLVCRLLLEKKKKQQNKAIATYRTNIKPT